jgi:hypothetical protein
MIESMPNTPGASAVRAISPALPTRAAFRTGIVTGALLSMTMAGSLIAANRMAVLEAHALERNMACCGLFVIFMLIPVLRFLNRPLQLFGSAMLAWGIFVVCYDLAGIYFASLFQVLRTPLNALLEGAVVYGVAAVGVWVAKMILHSRHHPIAPRRRRSDFFHDNRP